MTVLYEMRDAIAALNGALKLAAELLEYPWAFLLAVHGREI